LEIKDQLEQQVILELTVLKDLPEQQVILDLSVKQELADHKEIKEHREQKAILVLKEQLD